MNEREKIPTTVTAIGNAVEVVSRVIVNIAGNDISSNYNGEHITLDTVRDLAVARINANLGKNK
jgi:hypothetical protein